MVHTWYLLKINAYRKVIMWDLKWILSTCTYKTHFLAHSMFLTVKFIARFNVEKQFLPIIVITKQNLLITGFSFTKNLIFNSYPKYVYENHCRIQILDRNYRSLIHLWKIFEQLATLYLLRNENRAAVRLVWMHY